MSLRPRVLHAHSCCRRGMPVPSAARRRAQAHRPRSRRARVHRQRESGGVSGKGRRCSRHSRQRSKGAIHRAHTCRMRGAIGAALRSGLGGGRRARAQRCEARAVERAGSDKRPRNPRGGGGLCAWGGAHPRARRVMTPRRRAPAAATRAWLDSHARRRRREEGAAAALLIFLWLPRAHRTRFNSGAECKYKFNQARRPRLRPTRAQLGSRRAISCPCACVRRAMAPAQPAPTHAAAAESRCTSGALRADCHRLRAARCSGVPRPSSRRSSAATCQPSSRAAGCPPRCRRSRRRAAAARRRCCLR
jgi:hypothetical protein